MKTELDFFNTNQTPAHELPERRAKATGQEGAILHVFKSHPHSKFTPSRLHIAYFRQWPITSVRRAISNLTKKGLLIKTIETSKGPYGEPEHIWRIAQ